MKLAVALQERSDLNQEGEKPSEDPNELQKELDGCIERLTYLIGRINLTNCGTSVDGQTLTEMIARKDALSLKLSIYRQLVNTAGNIAYRARSTEIKIIAAVPVSEIQKQVDRIAKELRMLDNKLQETNWTTELIED